MVINPVDEKIKASVSLKSSSGPMYVTVIGLVGPNFGGDYKDYRTPVPVFYNTITIPELFPKSHFKKLYIVLLGIPLL